MGNKLSGFELICRATDCKYNLDAGCNLHTAGNPVIIGQGGKCLKFELKDGE